MSPALAGLAGLAIGALVGAAATARASDQPDARMLAAAERVARYIETGGVGSPADIFSGADVAIIENFPPYVFEGPGAVEAWASQMRGHLAAVTGLRHAFGAAYDFGRAGDRAFFSLPTTWRGVAGGRPFTEKGGWAFVLKQEGGEWRVRGYGWAVTDLSAR